MQCVAFSTEIDELRGMTKQDMSVRTARECAAAIRSLSPDSSDSDDVSAEFRRGYLAAADDIKSVTEREKRDAAKAFRTMVKPACPKCNSRNVTRCYDEDIGPYNECQDCYEGFHTDL